MRRSLWLVAPLAAATLLVPAAAYADSGKVSDPKDAAASVDILAASYSTNNHYVTTTFTVRKLTNAGVFRVQVEPATIVDDRIYVSRSGSKIVVTCKVYDYESKETSTQPCPHAKKSWNTKTGKVTVSVPFDELNSIGTGDEPYIFHAASFVSGHIKDTTKGTKLDD